MAIGHPGNLKMGHSLCGQIVLQLADQIALGNLCMVQVHLHFDIGATQGLHNAMGLLL